MPNNVLHILRAFIPKRYVELLHFPCQSWYYNTQGSPQLQTGRVKLISQLVGVTSPAPIKFCDKTYLHVCIHDKKSYLKDDVLTLTERRHQLT